MSQQHTLAPGEVVRFGTMAFSGQTMVFMQNLDDNYRGRARIRPVGAEVTDLSRKLLGNSFYGEWEDFIGPSQFKELRFKYAGAIMEVANIGHTQLKVWTDL
ncbi:hypothetical protein WKR88_27565 [Trinickia caryophylli]|uniref:Uncharacterized protein n=1 Tax=Trinickia caryophylli TaxID=28094 RepID=A0A1X7HCC6_TRICW|nr:hypothetical protein [Trinickia caryophylli]PMS13665.1 hypothetical protein C0Z17_01865 [Trinickia caryophylli]TRX14159.1 hypothetical protein FNF07_22855 [Trinickia caryophylli]WQE13981.1 hypothetical protein U0034_25065 [Trinickia caryophylli]SMF83112.1 hypothetical protein SAMN06295900_12915 [Trinickia caryophylli]GLU33538.1 hypothetical protein Busp01_33800 [Trinickia caryophylli]